MLKMQEFLETNFQRVIEQKQNQFDEINQTQIVIENELVQCIEDLEKISKDIELNYDNIINRVEESSFRNIIGYFKTRCENLKHFKKNY